VPLHLRDRTPLLCLSGLGLARHCADGAGGDAGATTAPAAGAAADHHDDPSSPDDEILAV
jgi:hypothetical protein